MVPWTHVGLPPNGTSIGSAVFAGLAGVPNRPRHVATSVEILRIENCSHHGTRTQSLSPFNYEFSFTIALQYVTLCRTGALCVVR